MALDVGGTDRLLSTAASRATLLGVAIGSATAGVTWWWLVERRDRDAVAAGALVGLLGHSVAGPVAVALLGALRASAGLPARRGLGVPDYAVDGLVHGLLAASWLTALSGAGAGALLGHLFGAGAPSKFLPGASDLAGCWDWLPVSRLGWTGLAGAAFGAPALALGAVVFVAAGWRFTYGLLAASAALGTAAAGAAAWWAVVERPGRPSAMRGVAAGVAGALAAHAATFAVFTLGTALVLGLTDGVIPNSWRALGLTTFVNVTVASLLAAGGPTAFVGAAVGVALSALRRASGDGAV